LTLPAQPVDATLYLRWQRGESLKAIGRAFGKPSSSIYLSKNRPPSGQDGRGNADLEAGFWLVNSEF
jgi:hypothetical protein